MKNGTKAIIAIGAGAFALKLWNDSKKLAEQMKGAPSNNGQVAVGGIAFPTPTPKDGVSVRMGEPYVTSRIAMSNQESNPSTAEAIAPDYFVVV